MRQETIRTLLAIGGLAWACAATTVTAQPPARGAGQYKPVKACSLLTAAEVKQIAPWEPMFDSVKPEEETLGTYGSTCEYPSVGIQVLSFRQDTIDSLGKGSKLESVSGIGDAAWARNNSDRYAELLVKAGQHLLTVQISIPAGKTFDSTKPTLLALGKAFAAKLR